jgi:hypothetical protein
MRSRTARLLSTALHAAALAACRDPSASSEINAPPTPTTAPPPTAIPTTSGAPAQLAFGQRCMGTLVARLKPAVPVDSIELRLEYFRPEHTIVIAGQAGVPCARATDAAKCQAAHAAPGRPEGGPGEWLVYTRGDEVGAVAGRDVPAFLAPIETPEEAAMALVYPQAAGTSAAAVLVSCDPAQYRRVDGGFEVTDVSTSLCNESTTTTWLVSRDGTAKQTQSEHRPPDPGCQRPFLGRRPEGLREGDARGTEAGAFFARCAELEAASVVAFRRLEGELGCMRAPRALRERARRARRDEVRHARSMSALAKRYGGSSTPGAYAFARAPRDLEAIAVENAVEGCVGEMYGALVATFQAMHAGDPVVRRALQPIARDETRHAAMALDLADYFATRLSPAARARVRAAHEQAARDLEASFADPSPELARTAGLPTASESRTMTASLAVALVRGVGP